MKYVFLTLVPADKAANNIVVVWGFYYINTLKRELVDTNAYKLQPSLSERLIVDGHGCHTALHFGVKAKENQNKVPALYCLLQTLVRKQNFLNCKPRVLQLLKSMLSSTVKRYMIDPVKTYFSLLKIQVKF